MLFRGEVSTSQPPPSGGGWRWERAAWTTGQAYQTSVYTCIYVYTLSLFFYTNDGVQYTLFCILFFIEYNIHLINCTKFKYRARSSCFFKNLTIYLDVVLHQDLQCCFISLLSAVCVPLFVCAIIYLIHASMNIFIHVSFYSLANISVGLITRSKIVGSKDMCILNNDKH